MQTEHLVVPPEIAERIIDELRDDRESLLACSLIARGWHIRGLAHTFRVLEIVLGDPQGSWRWFTPDAKHSLGRGEREDAFIRVTPVHFLEQLLVDYPHLVRFVQHLIISSGLDDDYDYDYDYDDSDNLARAARRSMMADLRFRLPDNHMVTRLTITGSEFALPDIPPDDATQTAALERHCFNFSLISELDLSRVVFETSNAFMRFIALFPNARLVYLTDLYITKLAISTYIEPPFTNRHGCKLFLRPMTDSTPLAYITVRDWINLRPSAFNQIMIKAELPSDSERQSWTTGFKARIDPTRHLYTTERLVPW